MKCCSKENGLQTTDGKLVNGLLLCPLSKSISLKPITSRIHWYIPEIFSFPLLIGVIRRSKAGEKKRPMNGLFTGPQNKQTAGATVLLCIYVMTIMTLVVNSSITKLSQKRRTRKKKEKNIPVAPPCFVHVRWGGRQLFLFWVCHSARK